ncbi:hypothetical protein CsSME_00025614 [Camellia sinensis var. sinensis]
MMVAVRVLEEAKMGDDGGLGGSQQWKAVVWCFLVRDDEGGAGQGWGQGWWQMRWLMAVVREMEGCGGGGNWRGGAVAPGDEGGCGRGGDWREGWQPMVGGGNGWAEIVDVDSVEKLLELRRETAELPLVNKTMMYIGHQHSSGGSSSGLVPVQIIICAVSILAAISQF